jgi:hypothetical protein
MAFLLFTVIKVGYLDLHAFGRGYQISHTAADMDHDTDTLTGILHGFSSK